MDHTHKSQEKIGAARINQPKDDKAAITHKDNEFDRAGGGTNAIVNVQI